MRAPFFKTSEALQRAVTKPAHLAICLHLWNYKENVRAEMTHKPKLIIIEDNVPDVSLVKEALRQEGVDCDLTTIEDGEQAISFARAQGLYADAPVPDLILMDMNLPKIGGEAILHELRAQSRLKHVPVILWSSALSTKDEAIAQQFHAHKFIRKPMGLAEFLKIGGIIREALMPPRSAAG